MRLLRTLALGLIIVAPRLAWAQAQVPVPGGYAITTAPLCPLSQAQTINGVSYAAGQISVPCGTYGTTGIDLNGAAFQGAGPIMPGTPAVAGRSLGYICTAAGNVTLTLADGSQLTVPVATAGGAFQTLPFAVTNVALGTGTAASFWNLR